MHQIVFYFDVLFNLFLGLFVFGLTAWAFINSIRFSDEVYRATFKNRDKKFWVLLCGLSLFLGILAIPFVPFPGVQRLGFLALIPVVISGIFLADMYPALKSVRRN